MKTKKFTAWPSIFILCLLQAGCASLPAPAERSDAARHLAVTAGFTADVIEAGQFSLQAYHRVAGSPGSGVLTVYIEGDGYAWASRSQPSFDPTPINPVALKLAVAGNAGPVAYLGRPCQYLLEKNPQCSQALWTDRRFAEEVVVAMNGAISQLKRQLGASRLVLVGFSGGGAVAALVAARRDDVELLVSVAGNLDPQAWVAMQHLSPLTGSLNPADYADRLAGIPQVHLVGADDVIVPPAVAESYRAELGGGVNIRIERIPGFTHHCCWAEQWPQLQQQYLGAGEKPAAEP